MRAKILIISSCLLAVLVCGFFTFRLVAVHGADTAMQKITAAGWHRDTAHFFFRCRDGSHSFGPGWYVIYQHPDVSSCFPPWVSVSLTGEMFQRNPKDKDLDELVVASAKLKEKGKAERDSAANGAAPRR